MTKNAIELVPPHNEEVEAHFLSDLIQNNDLIEKVKAFGEKRVQDFFYGPVHQNIFKFIMKVYETHNKVDVVLLSDRIVKDLNQEQDEIDYQVDGIAYVAEVSNCSPTTANFKQKFNVIFKDWLARRMIKFGHQCTAAGYESEDILDKVNKLEKELFELTRLGHNKKTIYSLSEVASAELDRITEAYENPDAMEIQGLPTGFTDLDEGEGALRLFPTDFIILAARPSMGKTALSLSILKNLAKKKKELVLVMFTAEMSKEQLVQRLACGIARVDSEKYRLGKLDKDELGRVIQALGVLAEWKIFIDETANPTQWDIRNRAKQVLLEEGRLDLVIFDYLQLGSGEKGEGREREIAGMSRYLKGTAKELNVPILALSQLKRSVEDRPNKRPTLSDLRESGAIEQDADIVIFIYRDEYYNPQSTEKGIAEIIVAKYRNGKLSVKKLYWDSQFGTFGNLVIE